MQTSHPQNKYRIAIVDDQPDFLQFASQELSPSHLFEVVALVSDPTDTDSLVASHPDVVLIDIFMPRRNGFELGRALRTLIPDALLLYFSVDNVMQYPTMREQLGEDTFISKKWFSSSYLTAILTHYRRAGWEPPSGT